MKHIRIQRLARWKLFLLLYGGLLVASHLFQTAFSSESELGFDHRSTIKLAPVEGDSLVGGQEFQITYRRIYHGTEQKPPEVLLLAGGPEGSEIFDGIIPELSQQYRLLIPDLPGYGTALENLPDYSFQALSSYTQQLLDSLRINRVHIIGYGLGGASAINMANDDSARIESVSLVSSIGVQELELMGSYTLNHAIHGVQVALIWLLHNAVPHFGLFDQLDIDVPYAKSFYESDQRPIRKYFREYRNPMLVIHGKDDGLVPMAAAIEHHRIVPHSKLVAMEGGHDIIEQKSDSVAMHIRSFINDVEKDTAPVFADATEERLNEAGKSFDHIDFSRFSGISFLIIVLIIILSTFISEDLTCIGAGLLAARGLVGFWPAVGACFAGIVIGNLTVYLTGRYMGRPALRQAPFKWFLSEKDLEKNTDWLRIRGPAIIVISRFLPGSRLPVYFSAGLINLGFWIFTFYFLLSSMIWAPLLVGVSMLVGNELLQYFSAYQDIAIVVLTGLLVILLIGAKMLLSKDRSDR